MKGWGVGSMGAGELSMWASVVLFALCGWVSARQVSAQTQTVVPVASTVQVTVQLRAVDGSPVIGEAIVLLGFLDEDATRRSCVTDAEGGCRWSVSAGVYTVLFDHPLDPLSQSAAAEGGLKGLGITVGGAAITYAFTLQEDGNIYFDTAPAAPRPQPFVPQAETMHTHAQLEATPAPVATDALATASAISTTNTLIPQAVPQMVVLIDAQQPTNNLNALLVYAVAGVLLALTVFLWQRHRASRRHANA